MIDEQDDIPAVIIDPLLLSKALIEQETVCPVAEAEGFAPAFHTLEALGFTCQMVDFSEAGHNPVQNLIATIGSGSPHLCFAGHMDVVPPGPLADWTYSPFDPQESDGMLIGRGASDMKCAIACFISALSQHLAEQPLLEGQGAITLILTGDEEGSAVNGTEKVLALLADNGYAFDGCIVGEPTSVTNVGDTIKIGRRGSVTFYVTLSGTQGHVAYPHLANNPMTALAECITMLQTYTLDTGSEFFDPSGIQVVSVQSGGEATNIIPGTAQFTCNIRFNDLHNGLQIRDWFDTYCEHIAKTHHLNYRMTYRISAESFGGQPTALSMLVSEAVEAITGQVPALSTSGGTSDARFITHYMPVVELGLSNATAHKVNEQVAIADIYTLTDIYRRCLATWFSSDLQRIQEDFATEEAARIKARQEAEEAGEDGDGQM